MTPVLHRFLDALVDGGDELARDRAADHAVDELVALALLVRLDPEPAVAVLAAAAGLAHELAFALDVRADGFAVGDLRLADVRLDLELALHAVDDDFQVQLTHAGDDRLRGFLVGVHAERRVFLREALQREAHLFLVGLGLRLHGHRDDRIRELHLLERDDLLEVAQRVAGDHVLQAHGRGDVAGADFFDLGAIARVHLQQAADALLLALGRHVHGVARVERARVDAEERQVADEGVVQDLEGQRGERRVVRRLARVRLAAIDWCP